MLEELQISKAKYQVLARQAEALESHLSQKEKNSNSEPDVALMETSDLIQKFARAAKFPE